MAKSDIAIANIGSQTAPGYGEIAPMWLEAAADYAERAWRVTKIAFVEGEWGALAEPEVVTIAGGAVFTLLAIAAFRQRRRATDAAPARSKLGKLTRRPTIMGLTAIAVFAAVLGTWSTVAPLASASMATGVVSPAGSRKTIEHLEGGIIQEIHVKEGDRVAAGAPLVTLDDTHAQARFRELLERHVYLTAVEARLKAEQADAQEIVFPDPFPHSERVQVAEAIDGQRALFDSRRSTLDGRVDIIAQKILQISEQNSGLKKMIEARHVQQALISEEIENVTSLFERGLEKYPRVLALQRGRAELTSTIAELEAKIAENNEKIAEAKLQLLTLREQARERANSEIAEVRRQRAEIDSQLALREDILTRTVVRAPLDGEVMNIRTTTETAIVRPGEPILDLVPQDPRLIIDAKISPTDIDRVKPGMKARVVLTAYKQRGMPQVFGVLQSVSADRIEEDRTGQAYFLGKVEVDPSYLENLANVKLVPGMPAEVMIIEAEQTLFSYLLEPLSSSFSRSFRED